MTEPVAWINAEEIGYMYVSKLNGSTDWKTNLGLVPEENDIPLYTAPPKKEWVGLTDEDFKDVERWIEFKEEGSGSIPPLKLILYIEAKLKEKNT